MNQATHSGSDPAIPAWLRGVTALEVLVVLSAALALFVWPLAARDLWAWSPAPFNARYMGAVYLAALLPLVVMAVHARWSSARVVLWMILAFTATIAAGMLLHLQGLLWQRPSSWGFAFLYVFLPINSAVFLWRLRDAPRPLDRPATRVQRGLLTLLVATAGGYGAALFLLPVEAAAFWPWPVDAFHARLYAAALSTPAVGAWVIRRRAAAAEMRVLGATLCVLGAASLAALAWTSASVPVARQADFAAASTWAFITLQVLWLVLGTALWAQGDDRRANNADMARRGFALAMGVGFTLAGIAGFVPGLTLPPLPGAPALLLDVCYGRLAGLFPVNVAHNLFHLAVGVAGLLTWRHPIAAWRFAQGLAVALALLTLAGLGPPMDTFFGYLPVYGHAAWLHGLEALLAGYLGFVSRAALASGGSSTKP